MIQWLKALLTRENMTKLVAFVMPFLSTMPKPVRRIVIILIALAVGATTYFTLTGQLDISEAIQIHQTQGN